MIRNKNKINYILTKLIVYNSNSYVIYNNFRYLKNEYFVYTSKVDWSLFNLNSFSYLIDMVGFDSTYLKLINLNTKIFYLNKLYYYQNNTFINIITNSNYVVNYKNSVWLSRECSEFYNIIFYNISDCRNLLNDYSSKYGILLKSFNLESYNNFKKNINSIHTLKKNSIIL